MKKKEKGKTKDKGEFTMLAVHGKAPFVLNAERKRELAEQTKKNQKAFLKLMKKIELQNSERIDSSGNKN